MEDEPNSDDYHWQYVAAAGLAVTIASLATINAVSQREKEICLSDLMKGRIAIVTGASSGIGLSTVKGLAARNASVIMGCRDIIKGQKVADEIKRLTKNDKVRVEYLDLTSLSSIAQFVSKIDRAHVLVNNAGAMYSTKQMVSKCELTNLTNHIGPFYLTNLLFDKLQRTAKEDQVVCRVINVASRLEKNAYPNKINKNNEMGNNNEPNNKTSNNKSSTTDQNKTNNTDLVEKLLGDDQQQSGMDIGWLTAGPEPYSTWESYANSKLCNLLTTSILAKNTSVGSGSSDSSSSATATSHGRVVGMVTMAVTPGIANTNLNQFLPWWQRMLIQPVQNVLLKTADQGARPVIALASADDAKALSMNGGYYGVGTGADVDALLALSPSSSAQSQGLAQAVWEGSEMVVQHIIQEELEQSQQQDQRHDRK